MLTTFIGPDLENTGKPTKEKVLMKKKKRLSQKLITLKKTEHISPQLKKGDTVKAYINSIKISMKK